MISNKENEVESDFEWIDGATPFYAKWDQGQPDNSITRVRANVFRGQHDILLHSNGLMSDELSSELLRPALLLVPLDYLDKEIYPDCLRDKIV